MWSLFLAFSIEISLCGNSWVGDGYQNIGELLEDGSDNEQYSENGIIKFTKHNNGNNNLQNSKGKKCNDEAQI